MSSAASAPGAGLSAADRQRLLRYASATWKFFGADVNPATHLPMDNIGLGSAPQGPYTSPTDIGVYLWSSPSCRASWPAIQARPVFSYEAVISPPRNWQHWADLVERFIEHLIDRYGLAEVRDHWAFAVWNEPNLEVFWSGTPAEYFHLYDVTAQAIRSVHPCLRVGGPGSAAGGWVEELLTHLDSSGAPLDFLSTHVYGSLPLDFRPALARHGREDVPIWWTEWGTTRRTSTRSGTPSLPRRSCCAACARRSAALTRSRTGSPPIISRSWARPPGSFTAASGCCRWATCASRGSGRSRCCPGPSRTGGRHQRRRRLRPGRGAGRAGR